MALFQISNIDNRDKPIGTSALGTPVYQNIIFEAGQYETDNPGVFTSWNQLRYDAALVSVQQAKKIVRTNIMGRDGTVKEYVGMDDYTISISGVITGANGVHPIDEIADLKRMLDAPVPISCSCTYLQNLGITDMVVDNYTIAQQPGGMSYQTFTIQLYSDIPQVLRLANV